jgi:hypothetical protein
MLAMYTRSLDLHSLLKDSAEDEPLAGNPGQGPRDVA